MPTYYSDSDVTVQNMGSMTPNATAFANRARAWFMDVFQRLALLEASQPNPLYSSVSTDGGATSSSTTAPSPLPTPLPGSTPQQAYRPRPYISLGTITGNQVLPSTALNQDVYAYGTTSGLAITLPSPLNANDYVNLFNETSQSITIKNPDGSVNGSLSAGSSKGYKWTPTSSGLPTPTPAILASPL